MNKPKTALLRVFALVKSSLNLKSDFDESGSYTLISSGADFKSGNAWGLIFAIFIASIGLNVNSTSVIIGAMLISPLMGPIVGAGFALGTHDFELLKRSTKNLFYAVLISVVTSTVFFLISPSVSVKSELLARTQPTIFDVLIAFFGGAAGMVASTRKIKGNAVPGVAIATALMPPLCTIGYSIAHFELTYAIGALYLFSINAVFILIATYLFTRVLGFQLKVNRNHSRDRIIHQYMTWGSFVFIIPSVVMAWYLQSKFQFEKSVDDFINAEFNLSAAIVTKKELAFDLSKSTITLYLFGDELAESEKLRIESNLAKYPPLRNSALNIRTIKRDSFSLNDLEERFVSRVELEKQLKHDELKKSVQIQAKASTLLMTLNEKFENQISDLEISESQVKIYWKNKPRKKIVTQLELETYRVLSDEKIEFSHSVRLK